MKNVFKIGKKEIGSSFPVFIIAEISGNHKQDIKRAYQIIDAAKAAGVDAIKMQTYTPDTITIDSDNKWFIVGKQNAWGGQTLYNLYKDAYTPWDWQPKLKLYAEKKGLIAFSTPFDTSAVDFLEKLLVPAYKISSFEINDIPLLKRVAQTKKPVILSRGLATQSDILLALKTLKNNGTRNIALLHCISSYPANPKYMNLSTIIDMKNRFKVPIGLSDHSLDPLVPIIAVSMGAHIIEKHLTLSRKDGGSDAQFSLEPAEFKSLVQSIRETERIIGKPTYSADSKEKENIVFKKSIIITQDIHKGEKLSYENTRILRPGFGLHPKYIEKVIGKIVKKNIKRATPLSWEYIK